MAMRSSKKATKCPECGSGLFHDDSTHGERVCAKCGLVLEEAMVDASPEWRAFDQEQRSKRTRAGAPLTHTKHDKGLTTEIGRGRGELFKVAPSKRAQYYRLTKWQKRLVESKDRNLSFALSELQRLVSFLGLPRSVHEEVAKKYEQAVDAGLVRGRSMESVIAALLYAVTRELGTPRTLEEISEASGVERREIGRTYRYIARELHIRILPAPPQDYVPRFSSMLGLSDKVQAKAIRFLKLAKKNEVTSGKGPTGVAAAALYIAAVLEGEKRTQREIADAIGVTEVTIRNRFKELIEKLGIEDKVEKAVKEGTD
ncbi:MAG: transcription initiation factor IIB [Candidatus Aenigmarchaeota archaeon]|nr:transcription initiation factor IIB [Candidatus Aenigmarchaeota archaeon]